MSVFAAVIDNLFADPNIARDAMYIADAGTPILVRVVMRERFRPLARPENHNNNR